jgi:hypothetical protein
LELQHVSLLSEETNTRNEALLTNSLSLDTRLEQITQHQFQQVAEISALRSSHEQLLRLLDLSQKGSQHAVIATKQSPSVPISPHGILPTHHSKSLGYDTIVFTTMYRSAHTCEPACFCACHSQGTIETPAFLQQALGRLFVGYTGIPLLKKRCESFDSQNGMICDKPC